MSDKSVGHLRSYMAATFVALLVFGATFFLIRLYKASDGIPDEIALVDQLQKKGLIAFELKDLYRNKILDIGSEFESKKTLILHFWASWCGPCVDEFPLLIKLSRESKNEVVVLAVSEDQDEKEVRRFLQIKLDDQTIDAALADSSNFHILLDPKMTLARAYSVNKLPESFVFNTARLLTQKFVGPVEWTSEQTKALLRP